GRAGRRVLVLERRERVGGACTLERPFSDARYVASPCAYLAGLLDGLVIEELGLADRGVEIRLCDPALFVPFDDGRAFVQWRGRARTEAARREAGFSARDIDGLRAYDELFERIRVRLRRGPRDAWVGEAPSRAELEELLGGERELADVLFEASIADVLDAHFTDQRAKDALVPQGLIGTAAGPRTPGTAGVHALHRMGEIGGAGGAWGYVRGGIGVVSFAICEAALEAGATVA